MKNTVLRRSSAALAALALAFVAFGVASVFADIPASAYVQDGLVVQYDAGSALSQDGKLTNLGTAGSAFDLTPVNPAKDKVADGWIHTETGWWMPSVAESAVLGTGYTVECYGSQTGMGSKDANYYFMVSTSLKDFSNTGSENVPISLGTAGVSSKGMIIGGLTATWNGNTYKPNGKLNGSVWATRAGTVDASGSKTIAYYENGAVIGSSASAGIVNDGIKRVNLGDLRGSRGCYWIGDIGSARIYNRRLTAEEIVYNANVDKVRFEGVDPATLTWPEGCRWNAEAGKLEFRVSFASNDKARGSVAAEVGGSAASSPFWCVIGDSVQLTPTPASGYKFVRWMGDTDGVAVDAAGVATFPAAPRTLTAVFVPSSVDPVDRSWSGAGDGKDWFDANNWQPVGVPAEADFITIGTGKSIVLTNSTEELSSLTLASTLACSNWTTCIRAVDVKLLSGAVVKPICAFSNSDMSNRVWISATSLDIASGASINANSLGYKVGNGPGWAGLTPAKYKGGSYGGVASPGRGGTPACKTYGSVKDPRDPGTGGGDSGTGGGAILVELTGALVVDGSITATGSGAAYWAPGGSGGGVSIACSTISGSGKIDVSAPSYTASASYCGCGGGGRIAVRYDSAAQDAIEFCGVKLIATGGVSMWAQSSRCDFISEPGTVYCTDARFVSRRELGISGVFYCGEEPTSPSTYTFEDGLVLDGCILRIPADNAVVTVNGDFASTATVTRAYGIYFAGKNGKLSVSGNATLKGSRIVASSGLDLDVGGDFTMDSGSTVHNCAECSIKAAPTNGVDQAFGATVDIGGHWFVGNNSAYYPNCNSTNGSIVVAAAGSFEMTVSAEINVDGGGWGKGYVRTRTDDYRRPVQPGSGSGSVSSYGTSGGGVVRIDTSGDMILDGTITAVGLNAAADLYGKKPGDGGSVYLTCDGRLFGTGTVKANGGDATGSTSVGADGGRVAIYYRTIAEDADITAVAVGGKYMDETERSSKWGKDGTVYWKQWHKGLILLLK